jgi:hypothetical protein
MNTSHLELDVGGGKKRKVTEVMCIWQAYIEELEQDLENETEAGISDMDRLNALMSKSKI